MSSAQPTMPTYSPRRGWFVRLSLRVARWLSADLEVRTGSLQSDGAPNGTEETIRTREGLIADQGGKLLTGRDVDEPSSLEADDRLPSRNAQ
jgi:hypothetical protein